MFQLIPGKYRIVYNQFPLAAARVFDVTQTSRLFMKDFDAGDDGRVRLFVILGCADAYTDCSGRLLQETLRASGTFITSACTTICLRIWEILCVHWLSWVLEVRRTDACSLFFCEKEDRVVGKRDGVDEMTWKIEPLGDGYQVCVILVLVCV